jgi:hypothetical protein
VRPAILQRAGNCCGGSPAYQTAAPQIAGRIQSLGPAHTWIMIQRTTGQIICVLGTSAAISSTTAIIIASSAGGRCSPAGKRQNPAVQGAVVHRQAALPEQLLDVTVAER